MCQLHGQRGACAGRWGGRALMSTELQKRIHDLANTLTDIANELIKECYLDWSDLFVNGQLVCGMMLSSAYVLVDGTKCPLLVTPEMSNRVRACCDKLNGIDERVESYCFTVNSEGEYEFEMK